MQKKEKGQFYTVNSSYILDGFSCPSNCRIVEPFAGQGDLIDWVKRPVEAYDIDPKRDDIVQRDTIANPPNYTGAWVITNPPYLSRNHSKNKELFDKYNTNDLYKCFILSLTEQDALGGIIIVPAGFFLSPRKLDVRCRSEFMSKYKVLKVKYFEETVFTDTPTTVVAVEFEKSDVVLTEQDVEWVQRPSGRIQTFKMKSIDDWIIGGSVYKLEGSVKVRRFVQGHETRDNEQISGIWLTALDSGKSEGRIKLEYKEGPPYPAKDTSRTYATLTIEGRVLSVDEQKDVCIKFNTFLENLREETWSLFLPQYRESKEYARKRIPFELVYSIVAHLLNQSK